jgi:CRP-like cAMP-binding protein
MDATRNHAVEGRRGTRAQAPLDVPAVLRSADVRYCRVQRRRGEAIFRQGDACDHVGFIESGRVTLSVMSSTGKEGVLATLGDGDFLGEGCLAAQPCYTATATAIAASTILDIHKHDMLRLLRGHQAMSDRFIAHMLARNIRSEADLVDHLFNSCEKRLARTLLLLAGYGQSRPADRVTLQISQQTLGHMVGTTRPRINHFLRGFKQRGYISYDARRTLTIHPPLLTLLLDE